MRRNPQMRLILPTHDLMREIGPTESTLCTIDTDIKDVIMYIVNHWLSRREWGGELYSKSPLEELLTFMDVDFVHTHVHQHPEFDSSDLRAVRRILRVIALLVYDNLMSVVEEMVGSDAIIRCLQPECWLGNSLVLSTFGTKQHDR